ncbi:MAG: hemerythrin family protein [Lentisphaeria bacterium]|nr:hemerythrin family protein [Lentisphaeria bacterium]
MKRIEWGDWLAIGVPEIDAQHRALVDRLNDVDRAVAEHHPETEVTKTLDFLADYAKHHFTTEEEFMAREQYPGIAGQRAAHREFLALLEDLERDFREEGSTRPLAEALETLLVTWLTNHIQGMDREFGRFLDKG